MSPWSRSVKIVVSYSCWNNPIKPRARHRTISVQQLSMCVLKFSRQQRKSDRITSQAIKFFSEDLICLRSLQWGNLSHVCFTYLSRFWFDSALILCGQAADLFFVTKPNVATDNQHSSNEHDMCRSFCNQSEITTTHIARSHLKRSAFSWRHERIKHQTQGAGVAADN